MQIKLSLSLHRIKYKLENKSSYQVKYLPKLVKLNMKCFKTILTLGGQTVVYLQLNLQH
jgi:hypothetical protein